jgi:DNA-binding transcriptional ArsR family regulator
MVRFHHVSNAKDKYVIESKRQMRALAAPTRQEIIDVLPGMGTVSVAELAAVLQRPADSLYYHLRILKRVGLVLAAGERKHSGRREALFRAVASELSLRYELGNKGNAREVNAIVASMLRLGIRDFSNSFGTARVAVSGPRRELWAARTTGWLSRDQLAAANRYIERLIGAVSKTQRKGRLYGITVVLNPLDRDPFL